MLSSSFITNSQMAHWGESRTRTRFCQKQMHVHQEDILTWVWFEYLELTFIANNLIYIIKIEERKKKHVWGDVSYFLVKNAEAIFCTLAGLDRTGVSSLVAGNILTAGMDLAGMDLAGISINMRTEDFLMGQKPARAQISLGCWRNGRHTHSLSNMTCQHEQSLRHALTDMLIQHLGSSCSIPLTNWDYPWSCSTSCPQYPTSPCQSEDYHAYMCDLMNQPVHPTHVVKWITANQFSNDCVQLLKELLTQRQLTLRAFPNTHTRGLSHLRWHAHTSERTRLSHVG